MLDRMARNGGRAGLATVTVLAVILAGCSAASAGAAGTGIGGAATIRGQGDPYQAGGRAPTLAKGSTVGAMFPRSLAGHHPVAGA